jgi:hypothetical protein
MRLLLILLMAYLVKIAGRISGKTDGFPDKVPYLMNKIRGCSEHPRID